jgi:hypothetical protein
MIFGSLSQNLVGTHNLAQHLTITPMGFGHKVMQRLVACAGVKWIDAGRHGLHVLARQRQHQSRAIPGKPRMPISMTQPLRQVWVWI